MICGRKDDTPCHAEPRSHHTATRHAFEHKRLAPDRRAVQLHHAQFPTLPAVPLFCYHVRVCLKFRVSDTSWFYTASPKRTSCEDP